MPAPLDPMVQNSSGAPPPQDSIHRLLTVSGSKRRLFSSSDGTPWLAMQWRPLVTIRQEMAPLVSEAPHRHGAPLINALVLCEFQGTPLQMLQCLSYIKK